MDENSQKISFIYLEYFDQLYNFGLKFSKDTALVEDSIQEVFIELIKKDNLDEILQIKFYLFKSLRRSIIRKLLSSKKIISNNGLKNELLFQITYSAEKQYIAKEEDSQNRQKLVNSLKSLPDRQKEAIYLKYNFNFDYTEIAEIMTVSIDSCRTLVYRGIKTLREILTS